MYTPEDFSFLQVAIYLGFLSKGVALGTAGYMAPEQARGEEVDGRSDLFSLGAILYEILTGEKAFPGNGVAVEEGAPSLRTVAE